MLYRKTIDFLLEEGCPSIAYRVRKEILSESPDKPKMLALQEQILKDTEVKRILSLQHDDGWLGGAFHGTEEPESCIRYLVQKGVESDNPAIRRALKALEDRGEGFDDGGLVRVGKVLDDYHVGGSQMIKACVFAYARQEKKDFVQTQIKEALSAFKYVANLQSVDEVYRLHKNKIYVFGKGVKWPSIYHLRLLAYTKSWRVEENLEILRQAFIKLVQFSPIPKMKLLHKSQIISPASLFMNEFNQDLTNLKPKEWMMWFHRIELIARLGIVSHVDPISEQVQELKKLIDTNDGYFTKKLSHYYFTRWTAYLGLSLENDWKVKNARTRDLTFRSLLILKLSNQLDL